MDWKSTWVLRPRRGAGVASAHWEPSVRSCVQAPVDAGHASWLGRGVPGPALVTPQKPLGVPTPPAEQGSARSRPRLV